MPTESLTIDSVESLYPLTQEVRRGGRRRFRALEVAVPQLSPDENETWQKQLDRAYFACGCGEGAAFAVLGVVGYAAWAVARPEPLAWLDLLWLVGTFFVAAGLGKAIGLARARRRLARTVDRLGQALHERKAHREPHPDERPPEPDDARLCAVGEGG